MAFASIQSNIASMLRSCGVVVTHGSETTHGRVHRGGDQLLADYGFAVSAETFSVAIGKGTLATVVDGSTVVVNGETRKVARIFADGLYLQRLVLVKQ